MRLRVFDQYGTRYRVGHQALFYLILYLGDLGLDALDFVYDGKVLTLYAFDLPFQNIDLSIDVVELFWGGGIFGKQVLDSFLFRIRHIQLFPENLPLGQYGAGAGEHGVFGGQELGFFKGKLHRVDQAYRSALCQSPSFLNIKGEEFAIGFGGNEGLYSFEVAIGVRFTVLGVACAQQEYKDGQDRSWTGFHREVFLGIVESMATFRNQILHLLHP